VSTITVAPEHSAPTLGLIGEGRRRARPTPERALALSHVPLAISGVVFWIFFISYWVPEFTGFPGTSFMLAQLSPLASKELTSQGHALVPVQADRSGLLAAYLLFAAVVLPPLARARFWLARLSLVVSAYLGAICALVSVFSLAVRGQLLATVLGVVLLAGWVVTAVITAWRSLWVDVTQLPGRSPRALWLLAAYALLTPAPVAVGRWLFARELRTSALDVLGSGVGLRWSALIAPSTFAIYLAGVAVGCLVAVGYVLAPPRWPGKVVVIAAVAGGAALLLLLVSGVLAHTAGSRRAEELRLGSPVGYIGFTCGAWTYNKAGLPAQTIIVTGATCQRLTAYSGFRRLRSGHLPQSLSPISVETPDGKPISGKFVSARYGEILVVATTNRLDNHADLLVGVRTTDLTQAWQFSCGSKKALAVRFVGSDDPDPAAGRTGTPGQTPAVFVGCPGALVQLDPTRGTPRGR
jgi:hypothetical protein